jgi:hypothetical protein
MRAVLAGLGVGLISLGSPVAADEAPIAGTVKAVDMAARTLTLQTSAGGKTREVVVHLGPGVRIVRFVRAGEPGKGGFVEQPLALTDLRAGWVVSVEARHEGHREVAERVTVVIER